MRRIAFWLSLIVIFTIPFEKSVTFGGPSSATFTKFVGLFAAAFWVLTVFLTDKFRKPHPFHLAVILFVLWNMVSIFWSFNIETTITRVTTFVQLTGLLLILWDLYLTPAKVKAGLQAYVFGAYISIGSILYNYVSGVTVEASYIARYGAAGFDANDISLILALGMPLAWYLALQADDSTRMAKILKMVNYAYVPLGLLAILLTASRGGLLSTAPAFLYILTTFTRLRLFQRILIFFVLIGGLFAIQPFIPESSLERLSGAGDELAEGDLTGRVDIWRQGIEVFAEHPLLGVGGNAFRDSVALDKSAHNTYLSILVELGLVGFLLAGLILGMSIYNAARQPSWDSRFWLAVLLVWALGVCVLTWEQRKSTWLFLSLPVISANVIRTREETVPLSEMPGTLAVRPGSAVGHYLE